MNNRESQISILKKIVNQIGNEKQNLQNYSSSIVGRQKQNFGTKLRCPQYVRQQTVQQRQKYLQRNTIQIPNIQHTYSQEQQLKLFSKHPQNIQIDCLYIQSRVQIQQQPPRIEQQQEQQNLHIYQQQNIQLPLQCLQSKLNTQTIKVHSSIDGMQSSKSKTYISKQQISIPLSDLIMTDKYMKLSNQLNQHHNYQVSQQFLIAKEFENLKVLKKQTIQQIQCIEEFIKLIECDQSLAETLERINQLEKDIFRLKMATTKENPNHNNNAYNARQRSKTPQIRRMRSLKMKSPSIKILKYQQNLQFQINTYKQKIKRQKQKSIKVIQRLSKAKSDYKKLQEKLSDWQECLSPKASNHPISPKSPRLNGRIKHYEYLQKQKIKYYQTLKKHAYVICEGIQTFKEYEANRTQELRKQIEYLKNQLKYLDVKSVEKIYFTSPQYTGFKINSSRDKSPKPSTFQNNYSQKLISTYSSKSIRKGIPPLSPRTPQLHTITPQIHSTNKGHLSPLSMARRMMKSKDMNNLSQKSTNYSQSHKNRQMNNQKITIQDFGSQRNLKQAKSKQNKQNKKISLLGQKPGKQLLKNPKTQTKNQLDSKTKSTKFSQKSSTKLLNTNLHHLRLQLQDQLSNQYCINNNNNNNYNENDFFRC